VILEDDDVCDSMQRVIDKATVEMVKERDEARTQVVVLRDALGYANRHRHLKHDVYPPGRADGVHIPEKCVQCKVDNALSYTLAAVLEVRDNVQ
jgi:hypothetical protein